MTEKEQYDRIMKLVAPARWTLNISSRLKEGSYMCSVNALLGVTHTERSEATSTNAMIESVRKNNNAICTSIDSYF